MYYITVKASPKYHQMTFDELIYGLPYTPVVCQNDTNTRTYEVDHISDHFLRGFSVAPLIAELEKFNRDTDYLRQQKRRDLYYSFCIPKKSGGLRHIDAPNDDLMAALRRLKNMFENFFHAPRDGTSLQTTYYHTCAFAYIKKRSTMDAVKRHQSNESKWFGKLDFSNFFGTTTLDFTMRMLSKIFPFCEICRTEHGTEELRKAVELGFLDGVLPQGTPLSPTLTNIIMVPIDYRLSNKLKDFENQKYVYTRYADDMLISSKYRFKIRKVESMVINTIREFGAPYHLNKEKTRYGSSAGSNWNLGVMLNRDNEITIGWKEMKRFGAMLASYAMDKHNGVEWNIEDINHVLGLYSYYRMVEEKEIDSKVNHTNRKFRMDIIETMKRDLHANR